MSKTNLSFNTLQAYADAGYVLFPLIGKIPPKGFSWGQAQFNPMPSPSDFPSGNFGVKLDETDLVIDVDPRNFPKDRKVMDEFNSALGYKIIGSSFTVRTGSGGAHIYLKKPPDFSIRGAVKQFPGIEFKTKGQYVVGAGSLHPDNGVAYLVHFGAPANVKEASTNLLELIARQEIAHETQGPIQYTDDIPTQERFLRYLKTAPLAIEGQHGDRTTFAVAAIAHDFGLHPDIALQLMVEHYNERCEPPWAFGELKTKVYNAYRYSADVAGAKSVENQFERVLPVQTAADFRLNQRGEPFNTVYNTVTAFNVVMPESLALNVWTEDIIFIKPAPWHAPDEIVHYWDDAESARLKYYLGRERHFEPKSQNIEEALVTVGRQHKFHPIKRELESYVWDGTPRLKDWLVNYLGVEDIAYTRSVGLKVLVAAIKRLYEPGCKFDYIMVLEGVQGIGKSRAISILGGEYYGDIDINLHSKDTIEIMRRLWIIEAAEMETHRRNETQAMKAFLSRNVDMFRVPYAKRSKAFPRQSIFIGTINPEKDDDIGWLKDTTGNRRYWPIRCGRIDIDKLRIVRNQLWAEALVFYKKGTPIHFEDIEIERQATLEQDKRMGSDPWYERIVEWLYTGMGREKDMVTASQIYCDCLGGKQVMCNINEKKRIAGIMRSLKWDKGVFHSSEVQDSVRGYRRPTKTTAGDLGI
jgi:predicted P-loop ATPase